MFTSFFNHRYAYFHNLPQADLPYIKIPLHTVVKLTLKAYGCDEERWVVRVSFCYPSDYALLLIDIHCRSKLSTHIGQNQVDRLWRCSPRWLANISRKRTRPPFSTRKSRQTVDWHCHHYDNALCLMFWINLSPKWSSIYSLNTSHLYGVDLPHCKETHSWCF